MSQSVMLRHRARDRTSRGERRIFKQKPVDGGYQAAPAEEAGEAEVRAILAARRRREAIIGKDLFADPAWDMLLELYAGSLSSRLLSITELIAASAVPLTTGLRWIDKLDSAGLVQRRADPRDARRVLIRISKAGESRMRACLATLRSDAPPL